MERFTKLMPKCSKIPTCMFAVWKGSQVSKCPQVCTVLNALHCMLFMHTKLKVHKWQNVHKCLPVLIACMYFMERFTNAKMLTISNACVYFIERFTNAKMFTISNACVCFMERFTNAKMFTISNACVCFIERFTNDKMFTSVYQCSLHACTSWKGSQMQKCWQ